jgi:hypothetical protein
MILPPTRKKGAIVLRIFLNTQILGKGNALYIFLGENQAKFFPRFGGLFPFFAQNKVC